MPTTGSAWGEPVTATTMAMRDPYNEERGRDEGSAAGRDEGGAAGRDAAGQACGPSSSTPSRSATAGGLRDGGPAGVTIVSPAVAPLPLW